MKSVVSAIAALAAIGSAQAMVSCPMPPDPLVQMKNVSFFDGDPAQMVELAPDDSSAEGKLDLTWQFGPRNEQGVTMVCGYSNSETQRSPLPAGVTVCKLTGDIETGGNISGSPVLICQ
ncbi:MAG: STY0301 family protein [Parvularculaceae bacterium]